MNTRWVGGFGRALVVFCAVALFSALAFPHKHEGSGSHRAESCRACKIQEGFSASTLAAVQPLPAQVLVAFVCVCLIEAPRLEAVYSLSNPRAPPKFS